MRFNLYLGKVLVDSLVQVVIDSNIPSKLLLGDCNLSMVTPDKKILFMNALKKLFLLWY